MTTKEKIIAHLDDFVFIKNGYSVWKHLVPFAIAALLLLTLSIPSDNLLLNLVDLLQQPSLLWLPAGLLTATSIIVYYLAINVQIRQAYLFSGGDNDAWLIKTDANGIQKWSKTFGGAAKDNADSVQQTSDGGYVIAGITKSYGAGGDDAWLIKTDSNGSQQWSKTFGGTNGDAAFSIQQTTDGGYILAGATASYGAGQIDVWLIKTDSSGNQQWSKTFGGTDVEFPPMSLFLGIY